jgi:hypothetical protein
MSDPAAPASTTLDEITSALSNALPVVETVVAAMFPEAAAAAAIGVKIAQGVAAAVPEAEALYAQFKAGTVPTQAQLDAYATAEDGAYAKLMADLNAAPAPAAS